MQSRWAEACGFTLVETVIGATMIVVAVFGLIQLFVVSARANAHAHDTTFAAVLAAEKMEQLRALTWGYDTAGLPVGDVTTDIAVFPERSSGGTGLSPSPFDTLFRNTQGYCDFLDARGDSFASGTNPPPGTRYIRRWAVERLPADPTNGLVLQVRVVERTAASVEARGRGRVPGEAWLLSVKTRKQA